MTIGVGLVVGAAALLGLRLVMDENGANDSASTGTGSFSAQTEWGEPDLAGVWRATPLGR